jgi:2-oxoglutarate ferredoxin oxidoreductase subunit alpha
MILADGVIGQMMEKVVLPEARPRKTEEEIRREQPWATLGKPASRKRNVITSLELDSGIMEQNNIRFQKKYREIEANEVRYEEMMCDDAEYLIVAFGSAARISQKAVEMAREQGIKVGLFRPVTLWPFPAQRLKSCVGRIKGILSVELNAGQMIEDIKLSVDCKIKTAHFGRLGGIVPTPDEVLEALKELTVKN